MPLGHQNNLVFALAFTICAYSKWIINTVVGIIFQINKVAKKWAEEVLANFKGGNPHSKDKYGENIAIRTFRAGWEAVPDVSMSTKNVSKWTF